MAQYNLALIYLDGKGRAADEAKAAEWMQKAAEQNLPQAQYDLGGFYQFGRGVPMTRRKPPNGPARPPRPASLKPRSNMA